MIGVLQFSDHIVFRIQKELPLVVIPELNIVADSDVPGPSGQIPHQQAEQCCLARSVITDNTYTLSPFDVQINARKQLDAAASIAETFA